MDCIALLIRVPNIFLILHIFKCLNFEPRIVPKLLVTIRGIASPVNERNIFNYLGVI